MGYDIHITRAKDWADNKEQWISSEEWLSLVDNDQALTLNTTNGAFFANWSTQSSHEYSWFDWFEGDIFTKNPDKAVVEKMLLIAHKLNANVQGDDGEIYNSINDFSNQDAHEISASTNAPIYLQREKLWSIIAIVLIALVIATVNLFEIW